jgi:hypothetical protein
MSDWTTGWESARYGFLWISIFWGGLAYGALRLKRALSSRAE